MAYEVKTLVIKLLGLGGLYTMIEKNQQYPGNSVYCTQMKQEEEEGLLTLVGGLCQGAFSDCSHLQRKKLLVSWTRHRH